MPDIDDIRRTNLAAIEQELGGLKALSDVLERDESQVFQWKKGSINSGTGKPRGMRKETARYIESKTGKPEGWLDQDHSSNIGSPPIASRRIPLVNYVQAGMWTEIMDGFQADEYVLTFKDYSDGAFALEIKGDSMLPDFRPGDRILVDPDISPHPGDFVVAKNGGEEATFKKYRLRGINEDGQEVIELVPLNPDFPTMRSDITPFRIIGTVIEHHRNLR
jgi:SOS-response transcriptional repressor LexA